MIEIVNENVHRLVSSTDFERYWKDKGFTIAGEKPPAEAQAYAKGAPIQPPTHQEPPIAGVESASPPVEQAPETSEADLAALKAQAEALGVTYHPNIGYEKLKERIEAIST